MDEIVKDFLIESGENLNRLDQELVQLETDPRSKELLASIFRTIHTIKGSAGFLGFVHLEKVAHAGENLLSRLRDGKLDLTAELTSGLLAMVDAVRHMLSEIQSTERDGEDDYPGLLENLKQLQGKEEKEEISPLPSSAPVPAAKKAKAPAVQTAASTPAVTAPTGAAKRETSAPAHLPVAGKLGGLLVERGRISPEDLSQALAEQDRGDHRRVGEILVALGLCKAEDIAAAAQTIEARGREAGVETVRVGVNLLDKLMNLVGELVLARNQLLQFSNETSDGGVQSISQRMNLIASELQEEVMKTRMQPIGNIWNKFPRTVRDLALSCGKEVHLEMEGQETELDRTIIEAVKDPLTHLVRNAVDHGIESPEARVQAGKPVSGRLSLRAFHEGGQVNMEIADDGAGLNRERILKKAAERGLVTSEQAARMPEQEMFNLIFLPGFSTAEKVTNVSGRGVGMDVVRTNLEKIGGTADLVSEAGKGTTVRIKIPLTLAIIPALIVRCRGERFAIPQISLIELVRLESGAAIERAHGAPVYRLRGQLLPLIYLRSVLYPLPSGAAAAQFHDATAHTGDQEAVNISVLQAGTRRFGLVVDDILDTEEIVVKPLGRQLKKISVYSGATIMGDGGVALILDVAGLARRAGLLTEARETSAAAEELAASPGSNAQSGQRQELLLAESAGGGRLAIPLGAVARLEEFPVSAIEHAGSQEVMQYRGQIIPLVRLSEMAASSESLGTPAASTASIQVVIYSERQRTVGLILDRIVDIVAAGTEVESLHPRAGVAGTCVVEKRITDLLDVSAIVRNAIPGFLETAAQEASL